MIIYRYFLKHTLQNKIHVSQPWFVETLPEKEKPQDLVVVLVWCCIWAINIFQINFDGEGKNEKFQRIFHSYDLAPVVQKVNSAIQRINLYPVDSVIGFPNIYQLDSDLSDG